MSNNEQSASIEVVHEDYKACLCQLELLAKKATDHLSELMKRGEYPPQLLSAESLNSLYALKVTQLYGNIVSGELLMQNGHFFEFDMLKRLIYESMEDLEFLAIGESEGEWTDDHCNYVRSFFKNDFTQSGDIDKSSCEACPASEDQRILGAE